VEFKVLRDRVSFSAGKGPGRLQIGMLTTHTTKDRYSLFTESGEHGTSLPGLLRRVNKLYRSSDNASAECDSATQEVRPNAASDTAPVHFDSAGNAKTLWFVPKRFRNQRRSFFRLLRPDLPRYSRGRDEGLDHLSIDEVAIELIQL